MREGGIRNYITAENIIVDFFPSAVMIYKYSIQQIYSTFPTAVLSVTAPALL